MCKCNISFKSLNTTDFYLVFHLFVNFFFTLFFGFTQRLGIFGQSSNLVTTQHKPFQTLSVFMERMRLMNVHVQRLFTKFETDNTKLDDEKRGQQSTTANWRYHTQGTQEPRVSFGTFLEHVNRFDKLKKLYIWIPLELN